MGSVFCDFAFIFSGKFLFLERMGKKEIRKHPWQHTGTEGRWSVTQEFLASKSSMRSSNGGKIYVLLEAPLHLWENSQMTIPF